MKKILLIIPVLAVIAVLGLLAANRKVGEPPAATEVPPASVQSPAISDNNTAETIVVSSLEHSIDAENSLWLVVNKLRPISLDYVPADLELVSVSGKSGKSDSELSMRTDAAMALESMFSAAATAGTDLLLGSGYRDSDLQSFYYANYVAAYGQAEADKFSAKPGTSEHQTGLVADVSPVSQNCYLEICFSETAEGMWVRDNAHLYGFTIRYPEGKESITGYQFEPWHLRYLGVELATELYDSGETLEEYFSLI